MGFVLSLSFVLVFVVVLEWETLAASRKASPILLENYLFRA